MYYRALYNLDARDQSCDSLIVEADSEDAARSTATEVLGVVVEAIIPATKEDYEEQVVIEARLAALGPYPSNTD